MVVWSNRRCRQGLLLPNNGRGILVGCPVDPGDEEECTRNPISDDQGEEYPFVFILRRSKPTARRMKQRLRLATRCTGDLVRIVPKRLHKHGCTFGRGECRRKRGGPA